MKYLKAIVDSPAYNTIAKDAQGDKLSHAYLVTSSDQEIVKSFFLISACLILCKDKACLECDTCKKVINHNHADVRHITPEDGKQIKVKDIEELIDSTLLSSLESTKKKLYYIYNGEKMNIAAQNKLLKTLEEPPKGVTIFIATASESSMLDTIKSRSRKIYIDSLDDDNIIKELTTIYGDGEDIINYSKAAGGNIGIAERLINDEYYRESYEECYQLLISLTSSKEIITYLNKPFLGKDRLNDSLNIMEMILRDTMVYQAGKEPWSSHKKDDLKVISDKYTELAIIGAIEAISIARSKILSNCNSVNIIDNMLFKILEVRHKCRRS